ncbi:hypothetical protein ACJX0J_032394, partial [Zea mays]
VNAPQKKILSIQAFIWIIQGRRWSDEAIVQHFLIILHVWLTKKEKKRNIRAIELKGTKLAMPKNVVVAVMGQQWENSMPQHHGQSLDIA